MTGECGAQEFTGPQGRPDQQVLAGFLPHGPAARGQRAQQRPAEVKGSTTADEGLRRPEGGQGMGRGRDAERKVPGPQGPATFRALRPAARVRRARAPTRRDVTATGRPARGLVWVSPGPAPAATPPSLPRWRRACGMLLPPRSPLPAPRRPPSVRRARASEPGQSLDPVWAVRVTVSRQA